MKRIFIALFLALLPAPAYASETFPTFAVDVTGTQVTDWRYRSAHPLPDTWGYTTGDGTQTLGFSTKRLGRLNASTVTGRLELWGMDREPAVKGTVDRASSVIFRPGPPVCEGGTLDPECAGYDPTPKPQPQDCRHRSLPVKVHLTASNRDNSGLTLALETETKGRFSQCGPDSGERSTFTEKLDEHEVIAFANVARRLKRLKVGRTLKLHGGKEDGCPMTAPRAGLDLCKTTDVTVEITRKS